MLTEAEYIKQQRLLGRKIHEHDGIFWEQPYPFYCRPAFIFSEFEVGTARPHPFKSLLGYGHHIKNPSEATSLRSYMEIDRTTLNNYSIDLLKPRRRTQVRQALRLHEIKQIKIMDKQLLERVRQINITQALRQEKGSGSETPVGRYIKEKSEWEKQIIAEFNLEGREWWGAFYEGNLAAYIKSYQIENIRIIEHTKADSEYLKFKPMDALYYKIIELAINNKSCTRLVNGTPIHNSLNQYKEGFLFKATAYPHYNSNHKLTQTIKKLLGKS